MANYVWLSRTHQRWKVVFEVWLGLFGYFAVLVGLLFLIVSFFSDPEVLLIPAALWGIYGVGRVAQHVLVYHLIRCPKCGANPTRRKSDGRIMYEPILYARLAKLEACPQCGYRGDVPM